MSSVFETLNKVNVSGHIEKKGGLSYVSWAWAWAEAKKIYPLAQYKIYENDLGWNYFTDGKTGWVKTGVIIEGLEHIEYLPIMDYNNRSIQLDKITSFDVNKTIQRSLTKALARHGLGLYVYAGEDLPDCVESEQSNTLDETLMAKCNELEISLDKLAIYLKKTTEQLTDDDLKSAIAIKEKARAKQ